MAFSRNEFASSLTAVSIFEKRSVNKQELHGFFVGGELERMHSINHTKIGKDWHEVNECGVRRNCLITTARLVHAMRADSRCSIGRF